MASETPEKDGFLAMINAKIAALEALRASYLAALSVGAFGQAADLTDLSNFNPASIVPTSPRQTAPGAPVDLPTGVFRSKSMAASIRMYLEAARRKLTLPEIVSGLKEYGLQSSAKDFDRTVNSTLHRLKEMGDLLPFKDGWDLASSYPESLRKRLSQEAKPSRKSKTKKKAKAPVAPRVAAAPKELTLDQRIQAFMGAHFMQIFTPQELADAIKEANPKMIGMALGRLAARGKIAKHKDGGYITKPIEHPKAG